MFASSHHISILKATFINTSLLRDPSTATEEMAAYLQRQRDMEEETQQGKALHISEPPKFYHAFRSVFILA